MMIDQYRDWQVRMCSQALVSVVHGIVLCESTSFKQPAQVLGSQDVWVSGPMIVVAISTIRRNCMTG